MKITDLAAIVAVRNHITTVMNDKSVSSKDDFKPLNDARIKLDKKFIAVLRETDIEDLFPNTLTLFKIGDDNYNPNQKDLDITIAPKDNVVEIKSSTDGVLKDNDQLSLDLSTTDGVWEDTLDDVENSVSIKSEKSETKEAAHPALDTAAAELALIAERVRAQKEQLKKEGRSNKRRPKDDGSTK